MELTAVDAAGTARLLANNPMPTPPPIPPPPPIPALALGASAGRFASAPLVSLPGKQKIIDIGINYDNITRAQQSP